jgi:uncharacterized protein YxeA
MKKILIEIGIILVLIGSIVGGTYYAAQKNTYAKYEKYILNEKAYEAENEAYRNSAIVFERSIAELRNSNDSLNTVILDNIRQLHIKDKKIQELQYNKSTITKTDTIVFKDTIFRNNVKVDTILGDKWYSLKLHVAYPDTIKVSPTFISEKTVVTYVKKEFIEPKKKFFVARWFQKKCDILEIQVVENSPYIKTDKERYIKIIK